MSGNEHFLTGKLKHCSGAVYEMLFLME